jgi:hypothetical protein
MSVTSDVMSYGLVEKKNVHPMFQSDGQLSG